MDIKAFGPVPSRRLGQSLGINNIPPKVCTYTCVYCQIGRTTTLQETRKAFFPPEEIVRDVEQKVRETVKRGEAIDYLAFVPDGEPTLDVNLGKEIERLKPLGITIAVITNASLLWQEEVRDALYQTDWVSVKIDAVTDEIWRKIDRPCRSLKREDILRGIEEFARTFGGDLVTETMLIQGLNDQVEELDGIAEYIRERHSKKSYLSIPTRPPAENWVNPVSAAGLNMAYQIFIRHELDVEYLIGYEGNRFASTGNVEQDILSITAVHPMREDAVQELLRKTQTSWDTVAALLQEQKLLALPYQDNTFYMRNMNHA